MNTYLNKITQGDCLELLQNIPGNTIDMTFNEKWRSLQK